MWTWHTDTGLPEGQYSKHIYLGETRVVTKQTSKLEASYGQSDEWHHQYYYHPDHLGSAQLVTDYEGNEYQRIEYTPYGELWVEKKTEREEGLRYLPYKFTAKEQDEETGLYYYGARYLDAKYSRWLSADPAVSDYVSGTSAGEGGIYNAVNFSLYHYAGNNPIKYTDPDGNYIETVWDLLSLGVGLYSFVNNVKNGDVLGAVIDGAGIVADAAALILPFIPGGAGTAINAVRATKATAEIVVGADQIYSGVTNIKEGLENGDGIQVVAGVVQAVSGVKRAANSVNKLQSAVQSVKPTRAYNRVNDYGNTPTASDRKALGAGKNEVVDHQPPLVQRYYEGDPKIGEKPGYKMTPAERRVSAQDRSRMQLQPKQDSFRQGAKMRKYSTQKKEEFGL
ncbi:hypothetical protein H0R94_12935 [Treponema socranskii]|uniref:RHS repeat-associated core domain-containing protein n=1 Tax=Treponema socranskii TaxID=53419 RepID=UPI003D9429E2